MSFRNPFKKDPDPYHEAVVALAEEQARSAEISQATQAPPPPPPAMAPAETKPRRRQAAPSFLASQALPGFGSESRGKTLLGQ